MADEQGENERESSRERAVAGEVGDTRSSCNVLLPAIAVSDVTPEAGDLGPSLATNPTCNAMRRKAVWCGENAMRCDAV